MWCGLRIVEGVIGLRACSELLAGSAILRWLELVRGGSGCQSSWVVVLLERTGSSVHDGVAVRGDWVKVEVVPARPLAW